MSYSQSMRYVILPQALRAIAPVIGNQVNGLLKSTSLVSVISMEELFRSTEELRQSSFRTLECFAVALVYYLLLTTLWSLIQQKLERRLELHTERAGNKPAKLVLPEVT
jgi:polar amino acid transport system permease protein